MAVLVVLTGVDFSGGGTCEKTIDRNLLLKNKLIETKNQQLFVFTGRLPLYNRVLLIS